MKKPAFSFLMFATVLTLAGVQSCKKDSNPDDPPTPPPAVFTHYSGSASHGDLVTFDLDQTNHTYSIYNQTTGVSESGSFSLMSGNFTGLYQVNTGSYNCFAVELNNRILAANFPTGNPGNDISYGISTAINNTGNEVNIAGDYIYLNFSSEPVNGSSNNKEWGIVSVSQNNLLKVKQFATGGTGSMTTLAPEAFNLPLPLSAGELSGSWSVNTSRPEELNVTFDQDPGTQYHGFSYANENEGVFLLDMGTGNGFILGLKTENYTPAQMAGAYKFVGVVTDGTRLGSNVIVDPSGNGTVYTIRQNLVIETETIQNLNQCTHLPNVLYGEHITGNPPAVTGKIYVVITGNMTMYFIFDNSGNFNAYGAGAKLS